MKKEEAAWFIRQLALKKELEIQKLSDVFNLWNEQDAGFAPFTNWRWSKNKSNSREKLNIYNLADMLFDSTYSYVLEKINDERDIKNYLSLWYLTIITTVIFYKWINKFDKKEVIADGVFISKTGGTGLEIDIPVVFSSTIQSQVSAYIQLVDDYNNELGGLDLITQIKMNDLDYSDLGKMPVTIRIFNNDDFLREIDTTINALSQELFRDSQLTIRDFSQE